MGNIKFSKTTMAILAIAFFIPFPIIVVLMIIFFVFGSSLILKLLIWIFIISILLSIGIILFKITGVSKLTGIKNPIGNPQAGNSFTLEKLGQICALWALVAAVAFGVIIASQSNFLNTIDRLNEFLDIFFEYCPWLPPNN